MNRKILALGVLMAAFPLAAMAHPEDAAHAAEQTTKQEKCADRTAKLNVRIDKADKHIVSRQEHLAKINGHVTRLIARAGEAPYNIAASDPLITSLQADMAALQTQISTNIGAHQTFVNDLQNLSTAQCGDRAALKAQAKTDFNTWKNDWGTAKTLHQKLRNDVKALLEKMQSIKKSSAGTKGESR